MTDATVPVVGCHRGVPLHDFQPADRLARVRQAIDAVFEITEPAALFAYAGEIVRPPEARLLARALWIATREQQANRHSERIAGRERLDAATAGLGVLHWAAEDRYCSMLDCWHPDYARVERRPEAERARLLAAQRAAR